MLDPLFHSCVTEEYFSDEKEETITNGNDNLISIFWNLATMIGIWQAEISDEAGLFKNYQVHLWIMEML